MTSHSDDPLPELPMDVAEALFHALHRAMAPTAVDLDALLARFPEHAAALRAHWAFASELRAGPDTGSPHAPAEVPASRPDRIGAYRIVDTLGSGGMGTVYLAEQDAPVQRRVALKVIKLGMDTRAVLARFDLERQALARMDHTSIARVYDAGATPEGRPYFVMEHVQGVPITRYCDAERLSIEDRLGIFRQVCSGVQHAHAKGVIHRDLTPNNVLVTVQDGQPLAKIIDFGLARATDRGATAETLFTEHGMVVGTPEYMSPEQAGLNALDIDTRSDVYTLGVLLYELLTGALPFSSQQLRLAGFDAMCAIIQQSDPERPSTKVTTQGNDSEQVARLRGTHRESLLRRLRGDLDWVVMKCLEKDRRRRYETVSELAADLQRHLDDQPVLAHAPSVGYRLAKLARRHRGPLAAATAVLLALVVGLGLAMTFWRDAAAQAREAQRQEGMALARTREFDQLATLVHLQRARDAALALYPPWPERLDAMRAWQTDADRVLAMRPGIEATAQALRDREIAKASPDVSQTFLRETLEGVLVGLQAFEADECKDVPRRARWAQQILGLTLGHPGAPATWAEARTAIAKADGSTASSLYAAQPIDLTPQTGLVPIGMNPVTKLWEFYELRSAWDGESDPATIRLPRHVTDGERRGCIDVGDDTGIVFVLLPGGTFTMGAQKTDRQASNHDPRAQGNEAPVHDVTLLPFLLARHEMTQGQWKRLTGWEQTQHKAGMNIGRLLTWATPMAEATWIQCDRGLRNHGLLLPTEAQWEYGCRAGTTTPWWTGSVRDTLRGAANLADQTAKSLGAVWPAIAEWPDFDDGYMAAAPVDTLRPNAFGMHHMSGNVWEWCADWWVHYTAPWRAGDGYREADPADWKIRVARGGSCVQSDLHARSSHRSGDGPTKSSMHMGVRAARAVTR